MTHVLMTTDTVGGVWTFATQLAGALLGRGFRVTLATLGAPMSPSQRATADRLGLLVYQGQWKLEWMQDPWDDVAQSGRWLLDLARALVPDVVHLNGYAHAAMPWQTPTLVTAHSCVLSWHACVRGRPADASWATYRQKVRAGLSAASMVTAPTRAMLDMLESWHGAMARSAVIPNGRDERDFVPLAKQPVVFSAGRWWDPAKNLSTLDEAAPLVRWPIVVAGDHAHPEGGDACDPPRHLKALGPLPPEKMAHWLGVSGICALPARYEPFGLTALEAALAGCALVLGDLPTFREVWDDTATYVDPNQPRDIAAAINELIQDPKHCRQMARAARERARQLTPQRMADGYADAYHLIRQDTQRHPLAATG